jgi:hypothetical protein
MLNKIITAVFFFLLIVILIVLFSPLEYQRIGFFWLHSWVTLFLGAHLLHKRLKSEITRSTSGILLGALAIIMGVLFLISFLISNRGPIHSIKIPGKKEVVIYDHYTLSMMGNPRCDISLGYSFFNDLFVWRLGRTYTKGGTGESLDVLGKFKLPYQPQSENSFYILYKEGYLVDTYKDKVYQLKRKQ